MTKLVILKLIMTLLGRLIFAATFLVIAPTAFAQVALATQSDLPIQTRDSLSEHCSQLSADSLQTQVANDNDELTVYVDDYPPYIAASEKSLGSAAKILKTLGRFANKDIDFEYINYGDAESLLRLGRPAVSYPYFYTEERAKHFLFSCPVALASMQLFYSRQFNALEDINDLTGLKVGAVRNNSYGEVIDAKISNALLYDSEMSAIVALAKNEIDVLPMAKGVMDSFIKTHFSAQKQLIKPIKNIQGKEAFRVMAPRTSYGESVIAAINNAIYLKFGDTAANELSEQSPPIVDNAELIPAEGFPAIIGRNIDDEQDYTLPIGTRVIVLDWSDGIRKPNSATNINRSMMLTSKVVILNGPHVGKEMLVRNMHIQLK
ncbi:transporter substrate-binding domain-containing protein [Glaciecola sp. MH2013]|uniref:substrate-binding periplasmic protein n=1 Tax=Glaciecola sp. MH2013 TaxID=2785524 RepID=UPI00189D12E3|nr:transporter substrate-binding domain-containing protein [Glaciecola sp. MH2013]MBF7074067.1 transporter substrate-binding domain-containing protein [Glaciecola sp. MH2013]